jgi:N-acetylmuramoyl-L-alanine amidase
MTLFSLKSRAVPGLLAALLLVGAASLHPQHLAGQRPPSLELRSPMGPVTPGIPVESHKGFASVAVTELSRLGWDVVGDETRVILRWTGGEPAVEIRPGTPYLSWGREGVHLTEAPYALSGCIYVPLQFLVDILPWKLPRHFQFDPTSRTLAFAPPGSSEGPNGGDAARVVVIDPGHGGRDVGARGPGGVLEKDVALGIARELARVLEADPSLEVHLTRDSDVLVPLWKRGELATELKGSRPGVFVSIHANAMPNSRATRGFETYFLSEARTEHERRVVALENSAQEFEREEDRPAEHSDLSFILKELRNLDHQHWSALLAELVQKQLHDVHPGPNRGVKQGPFAVITNALMPSVLVEVGFISNPEEERLMTQRGFQQTAAQAVADAIREFFQRYPPGNSP